MSPTHSDELARAFASNGAASVIESLLNTAVVGSDTADDRVIAVMKLLEEMAEHRIDAACCLMLALWPVASSLMLHYVCDGIDLWITRYRTATVTEYLRQLA